MMDSKKFNVNISCVKCGSKNVRVISHLDFTGWEDSTDYTGNIILKCLECNEEELIKLTHEKVK